MLRIGITGGIGSGKTTVARVFQTLGIPVFDADTVAKNIMQNDENVRQQLIQHFGEKVFESGQLNRQYLSSVVFTDEHQLKLLNGIVHPATIRAAEEWVKKQNAPYVIEEAALLFESGANKQLDVVIGVQAPLEIRIRRVMQRNRFSREQIMERVEKQMNETEKMQLCNYVIVNDEKQFIIPQVLALHQRFISLQSTKS